MMNLGIELGHMSHLSSVKWWRPRLKSLMYITIIPAKFAARLFVQYSN